MAELQLGPRQAAAILAVVETPGVGLGSLAQTLGADQPTTSALVDRLLVADLVRRETDPADRRRAHLYPTASATRFASSIAAARQQTEAQLQRALGSADAAALARILERLIGELEEIDTAARAARP